MPEQVLPDTYALGRSQTEKQRLIRQGERLQRQAQRFLEDAGLEPGMKVLDVGSGAGDVAMAAARLVGPAGRVTGVDMNPGLLESARSRAQAAGLDNLTFIAGDLRQDLPGLENDFDAITGRYVLCYVPGPAAALARLTGHLKTGGIVAFEEFDCRMPAVTEPHSAVQARIWDWMLRGQILSGTDQFLGLKLHQVFLEAGLTAPEMRAEATISTPGRPAAPLPLGFLPAMKSKLIEAGVVTEAEFDLEHLERELAAEREQQGTVAMFFPTVLAWARKP